MRTLVLDIETSPSLAYVWSLWHQDISLSQLREVGQVIAFAARWHGEKQVMFHADYDFTTRAMSGHADMIRAAWELINEADAVVHWNGTTFDIPHLNREFLLAGFSPPAPHKDIDLLVTAKRRFRFVSNKLDNVSHEVLGERKVAHTGFDLWKRCMAGDHKAWVLMRKYNIGDVTLTDDLYDELLPWIGSHPHVGLYDSDPKSCGRCGAGKLVRRGFAYTAVSRFQRFRCTGCGGWSRGGKRELGVDVRPA